MAGELSWVERGTHKPEVSGSIPLPATKKIIFLNPTYLEYLFY